MSRMYSQFEFNRNQTDKKNYESLSVLLLIHFTMFYIFLPPRYKPSKNVMVGSVHCFKWLIMPIRVYLHFIHDCRAVSFLSRAPIYDHY